MNSRINIEAVDALALQLAIERCAKASMGYGVTDGQSINNTLLLSVDRYAMDGSGFHVGHETFIGAMQIFHGPDLGILCLMTPHAKEVVFPSSTEVSEIVPAEEPHTYTEKEAIVFLKDIQSWHGEAKDVLELSEGSELIQAAHELGLSEYDYTPPDDDFAYQELEHHLQEALKDLPSGHFDGETASWSVKFDDGEIAIQYPPARGAITL